MQSLFVFAQEGGNAGGGLTAFLPLILIFAVFYLLIIRPQQTRAKRQRALVSAVDVGERVVTIGGIHGTVRSLDEETFELEVAPGTVITMARAAISRRMTDVDGTDSGGMGTTGPDTPSA